MICLLCSLTLSAQQNKQQLFQVMSYNVENSFDTMDNPEVEAVLYIVAHHLEKLLLVLLRG